MIALAAPLSVLVTLVFMYFLGVSLNILSMLGLMLAIGMLVDNAVVVTESIHRHQLLDPSRKDVIQTGVREVALAVTAGTITTCIVFLPNIVSPKDQIAIYLKHIAITICIALGISLLISLTLVPMLAARIKPPARREGNLDRPAPDPLRARPRLDARTTGARAFSSSSACCSRWPCPSSSSRWTCSASRRTGGSGSSTTSTAPTRSRRSRRRSTSTRSISSTARTTSRSNRCTRTTRAITRCRRSISSRGARRRNR